MKLLRFAALLSLLSAVPAGAEEFENVSVEQVPGLNFRLAYMFSGFRVENHGKNPAEVVLVCEREHAPHSGSRALLVPPGGTVITSLYFPSGTDSSAWPRGRISVTVDGRRQSSGLTMDSWQSPSGLCAPNWFPAAAGVSAKSSGETTLDTVQWPSHPQCYAGLNTVCFLAAEPPQPATMETLENFARLGGRLLIQTPPSAGSAPEDAERTERYSLFGGSRTEGPGCVEKSAGDFLDNGYRVYHDYLSGFEMISRRLPTPEVPVIWLAVLMLGFVVLIGPVNYFVLRKYHREMWILLTAPLLSLAFCGAVVATITFSEGWSSLGMARGMTWLDQRAGLAVTKAKVGVYSPLGFPGGLSFDHDELVEFDTDGVGAINLDLTVRQHYGRAVAQPRVPLYYAVANVSHRSERLTFRAVAGRDELEVVNGLGADIDRLAVRVGGKTYAAESPVAAGARATLVLREPRHRMALFDKYTMWASADEQLFDSTSPEVLLQSMDDLNYVAYCGKPLFYNPGTVPDQFDAKHIVAGCFDGVEK